MFTIDIRFNGPLFIRGLAVSKLQQSMHNTVRELSEMGEQKWASQARMKPAGYFLTVEEARPGRASKGNYRRHIHADIKGLWAKIDLGNLVYGSWIEGTSSRNQTTRFKGYHLALRTKTWLETKKNDVMQAHIKKLIGEIG